MNRRLHLCLLLLLALTLPLYGLAGSGLPLGACPMQTHDMHDMGAMQDMDCCDEQHLADGAQSPHKGGPCDSGHACKAGSLLQIAVLKAPVIAPRLPQPSFTLSSPPTASGADVWRPPRQAFLS